MVLALCSASLPKQTDVAAPQVNEHRGVRGDAFKAGKDGASFLGIPYAAPPVGNLRWDRRSHHSPWAGTRKPCDMLPRVPNYPQDGYRIRSGAKTVCISTSGRRNPRRRRSLVIVFFHGGSNRAGYSQLTPLGRALSPLGVVVLQRITGLDHSVFSLTRV